MVSKMNQNQLKIIVLNNLLYSKRHKKEQKCTLFKIENMIASVKEKHHANNVKLDQVGLLSIKDKILKIIKIQLLKKEEYVIIQLKMNQLIIALKHFQISNQPQVPSFIVFMNQTTIRFVKEKHFANNMMLEFSKMVKALTLNPLKT